LLTKKKGGKMKKTITLILLSLSLVFMFVPIVLAEEPKTGEAVVESGGILDFHSKAVMAAAIAVTIAAAGCGIGQGLATGKAVEGIARNPGAAGQITTPLIIGLALIESLTIYGLVISLLILFVKW
jgi:F-type H+-transporting ATPase subunit c